MASIPEKNWAWSPVGQSDRMGNELQDLVAYLSAQGRASQVPKQDYGSMPVEEPQPRMPMRGNSGAGWAGPGDVNPGTDWSAASFRGNAPGYSLNRGVREWGPESDAAADAAFNAKSTAFDLQERKRNRAEDWSLAEARRKDTGQDATRQKYNEVMTQPYTRPEPPPMNNWQAGMQPTGDQEPYGMLEHAGNVVQQGLPPWLIPYLLRMIGQR
jgi:hypothetical protein